jgi:hypothetical protein
MQVWCPRNYETFDIPFTDKFERHNEAGRFMPMKRIEGDSCRLAVDLVCDRILRQLDDASGVLTVPVTTGQERKKGKIPVACQPR